MAAPSGAGWVVYTLFVDRSLQIGELEEYSSRSNAARRRPDGTLRVADRSQPGIKDRVKPMNENAGRNRKPDAKTDALEDDQVVTPSFDPAGHVSASGDDETADGLNELDEETRGGAEDIPGAEHLRRDVPVFDRAEESKED
jgi:hypothetical protein